MKTFKAFLNEGKAVQLQEAVSATQFEAVIATAFNGGPKRDPKTLADARLSEKDYKTVEAAGKRIAKVIRAKTGAAGRMTQFGAGTGSMIGWWKGKSTPKTDMYIGKKARISLKKAGGSQLMSGRKNESLSTFRAAIEYMNEEAPGETEKLVKLVSKTMKEFSTPKGININTFKLLVKGARKGKMPRKKDVVEKIKEFEAIDKAVHQVTGKLTAFMAENPAFRRWFVYEAATGQKKFEPDPFADANWVVEFKEDGSAKIEKLAAGKNRPTKFIDTMASHVGFRMRWKTGSGSKLTSAGVGKTEVALGVDVRGTVGESVEDEIVTSTLEDICVEEMTNWIMNNQVWLTEGSLISSIMDFFKRLFDKIIQKLKEVAQKGIRYVLDFLGIELESIEATGLEYNLF